MRLLDKLEKNLTKRLTREARGIFFFLNAPSGTLKFRRTTAVAIVPVKFVSNREPPERGICPFSTLTEGHALQDNCRSPSEAVAASGGDR